MNYKDTLNLPKTEFPMRAKLPQAEPKMLAKWEEMRIYERILEAHKDDPLFVLHDGPPYANGAIHMGTALQKLTKDLILKSMTMAGHLCPFVPGWDCHGLPIEHEVTKRLGSKAEKLDRIEIRKRCRDWAEKFVNTQREEFKRLGVFGKWEEPYLTMDYFYEASILRQFGNFVDKGLVYRGKKPVHWCAKCKTALAEAEVEYMDHTSPSIYVKFSIEGELPPPLKELKGKKVAVVIWTTTPWTIPANLAIAFHPEYDYVAVEVKDEVLVVAEGLRESFLKEIGADSDSKVLAKFKAPELEKFAARHPMYDRDSVFILADYVTLETGTGCVHTAPGHGQEDYESGIKYGIDIYAPVNDKGVFTSEAEGLEGQFVFAANPKIVKMLDDSGALLKEQSLDHSYPHCWRCKSPVIFRSTSQWFISVDKDDLRGKAIEWIDKVRWIPAWAQDRIKGMVESRPDWCISRQRAWGVPIVALECEDCGEVILDAKIIESVAKHFENEGADAWYTMELDELLGEAPKCTKCGSGKVGKTYNILDVWFDSGVSGMVVLHSRDELRFPADLYLEGTDQHRGWFQSSLLASVGSCGEAPYKTVFTHGFVVDGAGKKMSKSAGNFIAPDQIIRKYGAEIVRLWVSSEDCREDITVSEQILERLSDAYRKIRNTARFMLGNLFDFDPSKDALDYDDLDEIDKWILQRYRRLVARVRKAYEDWEFHVFYHSVHNFCVVDLSSLYLDIQKDNLYIHLSDSHSRRSAQTALYTIIESLTRLMAPVLAFTADEIWQALPGDRPEESVHLARLPNADDIPDDAALFDKFEQMLKIRFEVLKALEIAREAKTIGNPLEASVSIWSGNEDSKQLLSSNKEFLKTFFVVSEVNIEEGKPDDAAVQAMEAKDLKILVKKASGEKCPRCWNYCVDIGSNASHPDVCPRCAGVLESMPAGV